MRANRTGFVICFLGLSSGVYGCSEQGQPAGDHVEKAVPAALAAGATVVVGPEIGTDKPVPMPTTLGSYPALASDGSSGFLAIESISGRIQGTRVDASGNVLDLSWLDFGVAGYAQYYSDVTFGSGHYLVAWSQSSEGDEDGSIQGRFVKPDGTVEGTSNFQLSSGDGLYPSLAWNGTHFIATWLGFAADTSSIRYALFNADGSKVAGSEQAVSTTGSATNPRVAAGTNYSLVTWQEYEPNTYSGTYKTQGVRIDKTGAVNDSPALVVGPATYSTRSAAVASSGSRFLVAWSTTDTNEVIHGSIVDDGGSIVKNDFVISHSTGVAAIPTIDFDGTNFVVAWADGRSDNSVYGITVSPDGTVSGTTDQKLTTGGPRSVSPGSLDRVNLAYNGTRHMLSYLGDGVEASLLDQSLSVVKNEFNVTSLPGKQGYPRLAWDGKNYVIAWTDESDPDWSKSKVRAVRISATGEVLDPSGILVTAANTYAWSVDLASAGKENSLIAYANSGEVPLLRTLANNGALGNAGPFGNSTESGVPGLASNGTTYLATYTIGDSEDGAVYGRILDLNATVGAEIRLDSSTVNTGPSAVPIKGGYLVSYAKSGTYVITVSDSGVVGTSSLLQSDYTYIAGACSGDESLIAWDNRADRKIHGRFFKGGTWSGTEFALSDATNNGYPTVVWDGTGYYVAWEIADANDRNHQLLGRSVSQSGVLGSVQTLVTEDTTGPVLASNGQGQMLLSYIKWIENSNSRRIHSRLLSASGSTGAAGAGNTGTGGQGNGGTTAIVAGGTTSASSTAIGGSGNSATTTTASITGTPPSNTGGTSSQSATTTTTTGGTSSQSATMTTTTTTTGGATTSSSADDGGSGDSGCSIDGRGNHANSWVLLLAGAFGAIAMRRQRRRVRQVASTR